MASEAEIKAGAAAIANLRAARRGAPAVENVLELLGKIAGGELLDEVMEDSEVALEAAERARPDAVPDMLAALKAVVNWYGEPPHEPAPAIIKARAAIAKAQA